MATEYPRRIARVVRASFYRLVLAVAAWWESLIELLFGAEPGLLTWPPRVQGLDEHRLSEPSATHEAARPGFHVRHMQLMAA